MFSKQVLAKWGVNLKQVFCPQCEQRLPALRIPVDMEQMLWGGWTCKHCGCRVDKWGRMVQAVAEERCWDDA